MPIKAIYFIFRGLDGYVAYLSKEYGRLIHSVPRILLIADLLVHIVDDLEIFSLFMLIKGLHIGRLLISFLK